MAFSPAVALLHLLVVSVLNTCFMLCNSGGMLQHSPHAPMLLASDIGACARRELVRCDAHDRAHIARRVGIYPQRQWHPACTTTNALLVRGWPTCIALSFFPCWVVARSCGSHTRTGPDFKLGVVPDFGEVSSRHLYYRTSLIPSAPRDRTRRSSVSLRPQSAAAVPPASRLNRDTLVRSRHKGGVFSEPAFGPPLLSRPPQKKRFAKTNFG